jgi:hypothetical protein
MKATLLAADLDELARAGSSVEEAFSRGSAALGSRPTHERPTETPGTEAAIRELVHIHAEAYAQMRLLQFAYTTKARSYERSKGRYDAVEDALSDASRHVVPVLRARLGQVKEREDALVGELEAHGVSAEAIGPLVPAARAQETSLLPLRLVAAGLGEGDGDGLERLRVPRKQLGDQGDLEQRR